MNFLQDCKVWLQFLVQAESVRLCRPFLDFSDKDSSRILNFYSDASKNPELGMGAVFDNKWMMIPWLSKFIEQVNPSIEYLELYAVTAALLKWRRDHKLNNARVTIFCDNESVLHMINKLGSTCCQCMKLIRLIAMESIIWNRKVKVKHVRSGDNILADSLSRLNLEKFWSNISRPMNETGDTLEGLIIWPMDKFWNMSDNYLPPINFR